MSVQETFISHLVELRDRLLRSIYAVFGVFAVLWFWPGLPQIYDLLALPMLRTLPEGTHMIATGVITPFLVPLKVGLMAAFMLALPYVLYQVWAFIAPGLYSHEKRFALPLVFGSTALFLAGVAYCYFVVFGWVFRFIIQFSPKSITPAPDIEAYLSFVLTMFVAFGVTFEIPLIEVVLVRTGIVTVAKLKDIRSYVFSFPRYGTQTGPGAPVYKYLPNVSKIRAAVANAFKTDPQLEDTRAALGDEDGAIWVLNGTSQTGQASTLAAYLEYYGLTASAPAARPDASGLSATRIVVYNGAEARLPETIAFLESKFKVKVQLKQDKAVSVDVIITTGRSTPNLSPPPTN